MGGGAVCVERRGLELLGHGVGILLCEDNNLPLNVEADDDPIPGDRHGVGILVSASELLELPQVDDHAIGCQFVQHSCRGIIQHPDVPCNWIHIHSLRIAKRWHAHVPQSL